MSLGSKISPLMTKKAIMEKTTTTSTVAMAIMIMEKTMEV